jgi:hypothetical protein
MNVAWEVFYGLGALALLGALAYGMWRYHTRNRANDKVTEKATHALYTHPDTYQEQAADINGRAGLGSRTRWPAGRNDGSCVRGRRAWSGGREEAGAPGRRRAAPG